MDSVWLGIVASSSLSILVAGIQGKNLFLTRQKTIPLPKVSLRVEQSPETMRDFEVLVIDARNRGIDVVIDDFGIEVRRQRWSRERERFRGDFVDARVGADDVLALTKPLEWQVKSYWFADYLFAYHYSGTVWLNAYLVGSDGKTRRSATTRFSVSDHMTPRHRGTEWLKRPPLDVRLRELDIRARRTATSDGHDTAPFETIPIARHEGHGRATGYNALSFYDRIADERSGRKHDLRMDEATG